MERLALRSLKAQSCSRGGGATGLPFRCRILLALPCVKSSQPESSRRQFLSRCFQMHDPFLVGFGAAQEDPRQHEPPRSRWPDRRSRCATRIDRRAFPSRGLRSSSTETVPPTTSVSVESSARAATPPKHTRTSNNRNVDTVPSVRFALGASLRGGY
jgi:hypothetical protein